MDDFESLYIVAQDDSLKIRIHPELAHAHEGMTLIMNLKQPELIILQLTLIPRDQSILQVDRWSLIEQAVTGIAGSLKCETF